jgi:hypothetical protein
MRSALLVLALAGFVGLGMLDLSAGNWHPGIAALLLAAANYLLLA